MGPGVGYRNLESWFKDATFQSRVCEYSIKNYREEMEWPKHPHMRTKFWGFYLERPVPTQRLSLEAYAELGHDEALIIQGEYLVQEGEIKHNPTMLFHDFRRKIIYSGAKEPNQLLSTPCFLEWLVNRLFKHGVPLSLFTLTSLDYHPRKLEPSMVLSVQENNTELQRKASLQESYRLSDIVRDEVEGIEEFVQYCRFFAGGKNSDYNAACSLVNNAISKEGLGIINIEVGMIKTNPGDLQPFPTIKSETLPDDSLQKNLIEWEIPFATSNPIQLAEGLLLHFNGAGYVTSPNPESVTLGHSCVEFLARDNIGQGIAKALTAFFEEMDYDLEDVPVHAISNVITVANSAAVSFKRGFTREFGKLF